MGEMLRRKVPLLDAGCEKLLLILGNLCFLPIAATLLMYISGHRRHYWLHQYIPVQRLLPDLLEVSPLDIRYLCISGSAVLFALCRLLPSYMAGLPAQSARFRCPRPPHDQVYLPTGASGRQ